ncbi:MAG TPA: ABC transporter permease, partial [Thermoanaerobaculia bacterium]|nr:ABC transporter permease [Thermoanaerobaculia bacterium]
MHEGMTTIGHDLRAAAQGLRRRPRLVLAVLVTLGLGIGANAAVFTLLDALMFRPLPFPEPQRLALVRLAPPGPEGDPLPFSPPKLAALQGMAHPFTAVAGFFGLDLALGDPSGALRLPAEGVSAEYLPVLGIEPLLGRGFAVREDRQGAPVALLFHALWQERFGADAGIVGATVRLNQVPVTVLGVLPAGFRGLTGTAEAWVPLGFTPAVTYPEILAEEHSYFLQVVARRAPGTSAEGAAQRLAALAQRLGAPPEGGEPWRPVASPLAGERVSPVVRRSAWVLLGAALFVLAIACANVAGLLLARMSDRRRELGVRLALGAGRRRLLQLVLAESLLLGVLGGAVGVALAALLLRALPALPTLPWLQRWGDLALAPELPRLEPRLLLLAAAAALLCGLVVGVAPSLRLARRDVAAALRGGGYAVGAAPGGVRARASLVVAATAVATVSLVGAGLMLASLAKLAAVPQGFEPAGVLTLRVDLPETEYPPPRRTAAYEELLARLAELPGVASASVDRCAPGRGACNRAILERVTAPGEPREVEVHFVDPDYFATLGIPVVRGRGFSPQRLAAGLPEVVINRLAARRFWPDGEPVGDRVAVFVAAFGGEAAEVVGVVADVRYGTPDQPPGPTVYVPVARQAFAGMTLFLRSAADPAQLAPAVRREVAAFDPAIAVSQVQTLAERLAVA